jgi:hypothetical protein
VVPVSLPELAIRFALALWVGGTLLLVLEAPLVFRRLTSRDAAGDLFDAILARFEALKHILSLALVIGVFVELEREGRIPGGGVVVSAIAIFVAVATNVYLAMVLRPRLKYFRMKLGSFDAAAPDDPWRKKFDSLHRRSVRVLLVGGFAAAVALALRP